MEQYILALDQGTTSSRAILFDARGVLVEVAQQEFTQLYPQPGWVEHRPDEIFDTQARVAARCLRQAGVSAAEVAAVGITNQRETTIVWDAASGAPVCNAIVWQDRRTAPLCDALRAEGWEPLIKDRTGLLADAYFSGPKIRWILDNVPGARERAEAGELRFGTVDTWLIWNFTRGRVHVTDPSNAARTLLFNIHTCDWDDELPALMGIPPSMLPEIVASSQVSGYMDAGFLGHRVPIAGMAGDQQAATFGNGCLVPGMVKNTYGTGCFLLMHTGDRPCRSAGNLLTTIGWQGPSGTAYALEGSVFVAGAVVQWLRDGLGIIGSADEVEALAASVPDSGGVYLVPAFTGLGAPHWDPYARGTLVGLTRGTTRAHIARAALEAIAFQTMDIMECMEIDAGMSLHALRVDGGASANNMLMQFQADLLGVPVERPVVTETTALGAAGLAGLAVGFWENEAELAARWQLDRRFEPGVDSGRREEARHQWRRAVERARHWVEA